MKTKSGKLMNNHYRTGFCYQTMFELFFYLKLHSHENVINLLIDQIKLDLKCPNI